MGPMEACMRASLRQQGQSEDEISNKVQRVNAMIPIEQCSQEIIDKLSGEAYPGTCILMNKYGRYMAERGLQSREIYAIFHKVARLIVSMEEITEEIASYIFTASKGDTAGTA